MKICNITNIDKKEFTLIQSIYMIFFCPYSRGRAQGDINHQLMVGGKRETGRIL